MSTTFVLSKRGARIYISLLIFSGPDPDNFFLFAFRHVRTSSIYTYGTNAKIFFNFPKFDLLQDPPQIKFYNHFEEILAHDFNIRGIQKLWRQEGEDKWTVKCLLLQSKWLLFISFIFCRGWVGKSSKICLFFWNVIAVLLKVLFLVNFAKLWQGKQKF